MVTLTVLGSGSSGNCAVVSTGRTTLLIDAGLSAKQISLRLAIAGFDPAKIDGILLTHEHQDHTGGLEVFCRKRSIPLFCTALTQESISGSLGFKVPPTWRIMSTGSAFEFQDIRIECFPVPHDAVDPVGLIIEDADSRLGVLSDVGHITNLIKDRLKGSDSLFVEANYDTQLLEADTKRPWATKQRISSRHGHLSNDQVAELMAELAHEALHHVVLGHLSDDCNDPVVAAESVRRALHGAGATQATVLCAERRCTTRTVEVARRKVTVSFSFASAVAPPPRQLALFD